MTPETPNENFEKSNAEKESLKKMCLEAFKKFRHEYYDELPPHRLTAYDPNYHFYKCRGNFFSAVKNYISMLIDIGVITQSDAIQRGNEFIDYVAKRDFSKFSTSEDIQKVNDILDYMIAELS